MKDQPTSLCQVTLRINQRSISLSRDFIRPDIVHYGNPDAPSKTHNTKVFCFITSPLPALSNSAHLLSDN